MPKGSVGAGIRSGRKFQLLLLVVIFLVAIFSFITSSQACAFRLDDKCMKLERAAMPEARQHGLSNREYLPRHEGMLFIFNEPGEHCFWMKDMKFSIDIIWLDQDKKVVDIKENVAPDTYPNSFCPTSLSKYVVEVNAGVTRQAGLGVGSAIDL